MIYSDHFNDADSFFSHVDGMMSTISDPLIEQRYLGFVTVSAVTVYELAIKEIIILFCAKKHPVFGHFTQSHFEKMNGRISLNDIKSNVVRKYGAKYLSRFVKHLETAEKRSLNSGDGSIKSSYGNMIVWRNTFVHTGIAPNTTTFQEVNASYERGKHVIHCIADCMVR